MKLRSLLALSALALLFSCNKDKDEPDTKKDEAVELTIASSTNKSVYDDVFDIVFANAEGNNLSGRTSVCASVMVTPTDPAVFPKTMTIDFGTGCTDPWGIVRKGKIIAVFSNRIRISGSTVAVSFENYYVNNYRIEGNFTITNNGGTGLNFTTQTSGGKLTYPDGTTYFNYNGTHTFSQTGGAGTITFLDDVYSITGNSTTTSSSGNSLAVTITTPLVKATTCHNVSSGVEAFTYNTITGSLDFGSGTCDNVATITIGSFIHTIFLP